VATIKVTASLFRNPSLTESTTPKKSDPSNILSTHSVRIVVGEIPVPIPGGPIQSNTSISFGGDFVVHWGNETAACGDPAHPPGCGDLTNKRWPASLPWANAFERTHFEEGYEQNWCTAGGIADAACSAVRIGNGVGTLTLTAGGSGYTSAPTVVIDDPCEFNGVTCVPCVKGTPSCMVATATATITGGVVTAITLTNNGAGYNALPSTINGTTSTGQNWGPKVTFTGGGSPTSPATATASLSEGWPLPFTQFDSADYFHEIVGKQYEDLWFGSRAYGLNSLCGSPAVYQCTGYDLTTVTNDETVTGLSAPFTLAFQKQTVNAYPWQKLVDFPVIKYDFWKKITQQGRGYKGLYYFAYDTAASSSNNDCYFTKNGVGTAKPLSYWVNELPTSGNNGGSGLGPGIYFFDTTTGTSPQTTLTPANLTPCKKWSAASLNGAFLMSGFIYLNAVSFGTDGSGNAMTDVWAKFPGEPYRDIGYPRWDTAHNMWDGLPGSSDALSGSPKCAGRICVDGAGDGNFSCQKTMSATGDRCDIVTMPIQAWYSYDPNVNPHPAGNVYVEKVWKSPNQATADYGAPCTIPLVGYDGTNARLTDCSLPHEPYLNVAYPTADCSVNKQCLTVGWEKSTGGNASDQTRRAKKLDGNGVPVSCSGGTVPTVGDCTSNAYDLDGGYIKLTVLLNGVLYNEGGYNSAGNDAFFGSLLVRGAVTGTGTPDIWFDETLIKGSWAPPGMPRVLVFSEQTDEQQQ